ncbi:MAG: RsmB/NOP family class I SAM-dependent RNA methyltransferase [Nanoarchaeota archaeon]|nr:RsmB/NOP family class I SAM-dependent RNA methyltransferase [Nanoarchaeota archaeon]
MTLHEHERIVSADKIEIKPVFEDRYKKILGDRYAEFMEFSMSYLRKCVRVNTLKISIPDLKARLEKKGWVLEQVPWCKEGFFVQGHEEMDRFDIGNLPEHALGYFYVQEAASMLPPTVLFSDIKENDADYFKELKVLDLCAAPGSKTTQIAQYMKNEGVLIANDVDISRLRPLTMNLQRIGVKNMLITLNAFQYSKNNGKPRNPFGEEKEFFDRILVDAPCSGTGTIRRSFKALTMYSPGLIRRLVATQKTLIKHAFNMLKPGGTMVYSTCTQEPAENEAIVSFLLNQFDNAEILPIDLDIKRTPAITEFEDLDIRPETKDCLRIYPQDNDTEGFFVCKIRKNA